MNKRLYIVIPAALLLVLSFFSVFPGVIPSSSALYNAGAILFNNYNVYFEIFYSVTTLFSNLVIANVILAFILPGFLTRVLRQKELKKFPRGVLYITAFLAGTYIILIFPSSHWALSVILAPVSLIITYNHLVPSLNKLRGGGFEFLGSVLKGDSGRAGDIMVRSLLKSRIYDNIRETLNTLWVWLLIFEFISGYNYGLGAILRVGFEYWSLPLFAAASLITVLCVSVLNFIVAYTLDTIKTREFR